MSRSTRVSLAVLLGLWALFFWRLAAPADRLMYLPGDFTETFWQFRALNYRAWAQGGLALWAECLYAGYPLHADPQAQMFYPPAWVTALMLRLQGWGHFPLEALTAEVSLHYLWVSLTLFALLRTWQVRHSAALVGAVTFTYGGYLTGYPPLQTAVLMTNAWLPLAVLGAHRWAVTGQARAGAFTALMLALAFLAGHPQTFVFVALLTVSYWTWACWQTRWPARRWFLALLALLLGVSALGAVQLLPSAQFIALSTRASVSFAQASAGFPFVDVAQFILPGMVSYWSPLYVGVLPLTLAVFALRGARADRWFWGGVAALAGLAAFGTAGVVYDVAYWSVPGLSLFRGAERLAGLVSFALSVLSAFGAHDALGALSRADRRAWHMLGRGVWTLAGGLGALTLVVALAGAANLIPLGDPAQRLARAGVMFTLLGGVWLARGRWRRAGRRHVWPALLVALTALDLFGVARWVNLQPATQPFPPTPLVEAFTAERGFFRVQDDAQLPGHAGCAYGYRAIEGVTPYKLANYQRLMTHESELDRWRWLGVGYVVSWRQTLYDAHGAMVAEPVARLDTPDSKGNYPTTHRLLEAPRRAWLNAPTAVPVTVLADQPGWVEMHVTAPGADMLTVNSFYFPGWQATVNNQPAPVTTTGYFLEVAVPAGESRITLRYAPPLLGVGGGLSALAGLACLALMLWRPRHVR